MKRPPVGTLRDLRGLPLAALVLSLSLLPAYAAAQAVSPEALARYGQMLEKSPSEGTAFDKVVQAYQEGGGLEKLETEWKAKAGDPLKAPTYKLLLGFLAERRNQVEQARLYYNEASQAAPESHRSWQALGHLYLRAGNIPEAVKALEKALSCQAPPQEKAEIMRRLGQAHQRSLDSAKALAVWKQMAEEFPSDAYALQEAGEALLDAEQFEDAKIVYKKWVALTEEGTPSRVEALMKLAELEDRRGKTSEACAQYETLLGLTSESSWLNREIRNRIEQMYRRQDDLPGLTEYYGKWLTGKPKDVEAALRLSRVLADLDRKAESLDWLTKASLLAPDRKEVRLAMARAKISEKHYVEAEKILQNLAAVDPQDTRYWELLAETQLQRNTPSKAGDRQDALTSLKKIAPSGTKNLALILQAADLLRTHGFEQESLTEYRRALELAPDAGDARLRFVEYLLELKQKDEAWKVLEAMTAGKLATAANYNRLAAAWKRYEEKARAYEAVAQGLTLDPAFFDLLWFQWNLFVEDKKWDEALALYDKLLSSAPNTYFAEQVEARHAQTLAAAGKLDETVAALSKRIGSEPSLNESELRVLGRIMIQRSDAEGFKSLMAEARKLFPSSQSLLRMEAGQLRSTGDLDGAVIALEKLSQLVPQQKTDWLTEIARIRMQQGKTEEALAAAQQVIEASPANSAGYLLQADLAVAAGKVELSQQKLREAIRLSDRPNEVRLRLAKLYQDSGELPKASAMYEEAFEAAQNPQERISLMKPLSEIYFQQGKVDELIERLKKRQKGEEGGWRYGLYLAELYQQLQDYGAARRELARSLSQRSDDPNLLRQLVALAEREGDGAETLRYRLMLSEVDKSPTQQIALANEYIRQQQQAEAWQVVQKNRKDFEKDPLAWREVVEGLNGPEYAKQVRELLEESVRSKPNDFQSQLALAEFQILIKDNIGAERSLWNLFSLPLPEVPPAQNNPSATAQVSNMRVQYNPFFGTRGKPSPLMERIQKSYLYQNQAQRLFQSQVSGMRRYRGNLRSMRMHGISQNTAPSKPEEARDQALVYLSVLAVQQNKAEDFLKELEKRLGGPQIAPKERVAAYMMVQAREALWAELEKAGVSPGDDTDFLQCALMATNFYQMQAQSGSPDKTRLDRAKALAKIFREQMGKHDPASARSNLVMEILINPEAERSEEQRKSALAELRKMLKPESQPEEFLMLLWPALALNDWTLVEEIVDAVVKSDKSKWNVMMQQQTAYLPLSLFQMSMRKNEQQPDPAKLMALSARLMRIGYPATKPTATLGGGTMGMTAMQSRYSNNNQFPPPNRYINSMQGQMLNQFYVQLKQRKLTEDYIKLLAKEEAELDGWKKIYPRLHRVYFQWWDNQKDDAIASMRELLREESGDDLKICLATMLSMNEKHAEAITLLESLSVRFGPDYIQAQQRLLSAAKLAKDNETAKKAALRLVSLRLPPEERSMLIQDLRELGLTEKADEITKQSATNTFSGSARNYEADQRLVELLRKHVNSSDPEKGMPLARQILNRPPAPNQGNENWMRSTAVGAIKKFGQLEVFAAETEKELKNTPDSVRINYVLADLYSTMADSVMTQYLAGAPLWLKLKREKNKFSGFFSNDGKDWKPLDTFYTLPMNELLLAGIAISGHSATNTASAEVEVISLVRAADVMPAPEWKDLSMGSITSSKSKIEGNSIRIESGGGDIWNEKDTCHFVCQELQGDGELVVKIKAFEAGLAEYAKIGLMFRENDKADAKNVSILLSGKKGLALQRRIKEGERSNSSRGYPQYAHPLWYEVERKGNKLETRLSPDGTQWITVETRELQLDEKVLVGLVAGATSSNVTMNAVWEEAEITGKTEESEWKNLNFGVKEGAVLTAEGVRVSLTAPQPSKNAGSSFFYKTLSGDGKIRARMQEFSASNNSSWSGLAIRKAANPSSPELSMTIRAGNVFVSRYDSDYRARAIALYRKVADLNPGNMDFQRRIMEELVKREEYEAAADFLEAQMNTDMQKTLQSNSGQLLQVFKESGRTARLMEKIEAWKIPVSNPLAGGGSSDTGYLLGNLGRELIDQGMLEEGVKVLKKGFDASESYNQLDLGRQLVDVLVDLDRKAEAEQYLIASIIPVGQEKKDNQVLGFNQRVYYGSTLRSGISSHGDGRVSSPAVGMLYKAGRMGIMDKLVYSLEKAEKEGVLPLQDANYARILLAVIRRDPEYAKALEEWKKDPNFNSGDMSGLLVLQELVRWKEQEAVIRPLIKEFKESSSSNQSQQGMGMPIHYITHEFAENIGDKQLLKENLKEMAAGLEQQSVSGQHFNMEGAFRILNLMINEGLTQECSKLAAVIRESSMFKQQKQYQERFRAIQGDLDFLAKQEGAVSLAFGLVPATSDKRTLFWEINSALSKENRDENSMPAYLRRHDSTLKYTRCTLEILGGSEPDKLQLLYSIPQPQLSGSCELELPDTVVYLQAFLKPVEGEKNDGSKSQVLRVTQEANLIANASFSAADQNTWGGEIPSWKGLFESDLVRIKNKGPLPGSGYVRMNKSGREKQKLAGERITVDPGRVYVSSIWFCHTENGSCRFGIRELDKDGKELTISWMDFYSEHPAWSWKQQIIRGKNVTGSGAVMRAETVYLEPVLEINGSFNLGGLHLGTLKNVVTAVTENKP